MRTTAKALISLGVLGGSICLAQSYRCDWSVVGMGGGEMSSSAYKCVATAGQTAAGFMTSPDYWALVGYWLPEGQTGVQEPAQRPGQGPLVTRLYAPKPNPFRGGVVIRYSLAATGRASLQVCDLAGRVVWTPANGQTGRHTVTFAATDGQHTTTDSTVISVFALPRIDSQPVSMLRCAGESAKKMRVAGINSETAGDFVFNLCAMIIMVSSTCKVYRQPAFMPLH